MLLPVLFLCCQASIQSDPLLDQKVSFETAAATATATLREISRVTGANLSATGPVASEMLILRFDRVPLREAMEKTAEAVSAKWLKTDEGYELKRTQDIVDAIEFKEHKERVAALEKLFKEQPPLVPVFNDSIALLLHQQMTRPERVDEDPDQWQAQVNIAVRADQSVPDARFAAKLLRSLGLDAISDLPEKRNVFSTNPSRLQRPLPAGTLDLVRKFVEEQNVWHRVAAPPDDATAVLRYDSINDRWPTADTREIVGEPVHCLLSVEPRYEVQSLWLHFFLSDKDGKVLMDGSRNVPQMRWPPLIQYSEGDNEPSEAPEQTADIKLSLPAQQLSNRSDEGSRKDHAIHLPPKELAPYFLQPDRYEPLDLFPSEPLLRAAEAKRISLAACIDDKGFATGTTGVADQILKDEPSGFDRSREANWLVIKPKHPLATEHVDRTVLGRVFRDYFARGRLTLETKADWALCSSNASGGQLFTQMGQFASPYDSDFDFFGNNWDDLRLFGALSPRERESLCQGGFLRFGNMTVRQSGIVSDRIFSQEPEPYRWGLEDGSQAPSIIFVEEPTYRYANGIDPSIPLRMEQEAKTVLFVTTKDSDGDPSEQEEDLDQIASELLDRQTPKKLDPDESPPPTVVGYSLGTHRTYTLHIVLDGDDEISGSLNDSEKVPGPLLSLDQLPASVQKLIADKIEELKKVRDDDGGGGDGGPPPPHGRRLR